MMCGSALSIRREAQSAVESREELAAVRLRIEIARGAAPRPPLAPRPGVVAGWGHATSNPCGPAYRAHAGCAVFAASGAWGEAVVRRRVVSMGSYTEIICEMVSPGKPKEALGFIVDGAAICLRAYGGCGPSTMTAARRSWKCFGSGGMRTSSN